MGQVLGINRKTQASAAQLPHQTVASDLVAGRRIREIGGKTARPVVANAEIVAADQREVVRQAGMDDAEIMGRKPWLSASSRMKGDGPLAKESSKP